MENMTDDRHYTDYCARRLLDCVLDGSDIHQILSVGYELLQNPICLFDNHFKYISYTKNAKVDVPLWDNMEKHGFISLELLNLMKEERLFERDVRQKSPFICEKGIFRYERIVSHIELNNSKIATMIVWGSQRSFKPVDLKVAELLQKVLSRIFEKNLSPTLSKGAAYELFLKDLLEGRLASEEIIDEKLKTLNWTLKERLHLLTVDMGEYDSSYMTQEFLRNSIEENLPGSRAMVYNTYIVVIISRDGRQPPLKDDLQKISDFFRQQKILGGLSLGFSHLKDIRNRFGQSLAAIRLGSVFTGGYGIFDYQEYVLFDMLDFQKQHGRLLPLCRAELMELARYDSEKKSDYMDTLYQFLINERNIVKTAETLHTHRSTLVYRLKKIQEIIKADLDDPEVRLQLLLSFKVLELMKRGM